MAVAVCRFRGSPVRFGREQQLTRRESDRVQVRDAKPHDMGLQISGGPCESASENLSTEFFAFCSCSTRIGHGAHSGFERDQLLLCRRLSTIALALTIPSASSTGLDLVEAGFERVQPKATAGA